MKTLQRAISVLYVSIVLVGHSTTVAADRSIVTDISPTPGSTLVSPLTNIIIRSSDIIDNKNINSESLINVEGSKSGHHSGTLIVSDDSKTLVFTPIDPFVLGEVVTVFLQRGLQTARNMEVDPMSFSFTITPTSRNTVHGANPLDGSSAVFATPRANESDARNQTSKALFDNPVLPADFPKIKITDLGTTAPGYVFISSFGWTSDVVASPFLLILDNFGNPVFYREMPASCMDFKLQPNGHLTYFDRSENIFYELDSSYTIVNTYACGNGYSTDLHELLILPNGHSMLMSYDPQVVDMSAIVSGGNGAATVSGLIIQELDRQKNVVFQWRSWDHFKITDATHESMTAATIDYVHGNALQVDTDGNLLLSSRHMDEITKIDRGTGEILWRMGGKNNQFTFVNDSVGFSHQHAIRKLPNGHMTMFDNGNFHTPQFSRAVEYTVDEGNKTVTLVWQYRNTPDNYGVAMGYVDRLPNGNTLIGWGVSTPSVTEVNSDGVKLFELSLPDNVVSYRAYRFVWDVNATPTAVHDKVTSALMPGEVQLNSNYPNPFNPNTKISFVLGSTGNATLKVYNLLGEEVATIVNGVFPAGEIQTVNFDASGLPSGVYCYQLRSSGKTQLKKMLLLK